MNLVRWYSHKIRDTPKYSISITIHNHFWYYAFFEKVIIKSVKWNNKSWKLSIILNIWGKKEWPQPVYQDSWKKIYHHLWRNLDGRNYICEMQQNGKIDDKFKIINPIHHDKNFVEDPLEIHANTFISEISVDTTLTLIMTTIAKPIKVLSMNILIVMIQIKLHLIV